MLSSQLSKLLEILTEEQLSIVESYITSLTGNLKITVSKFVRETGFDIALAKQILNKLVDMDIFSLNFTIRCPECGLLLESTENISEIPSEVSCYNCELESDVSTRDVEVIYVIKNIPFAIGHQNKNTAWSTKTGVLTEDSLATLLQDNNYNINSMIYAPTQDEYMQLEQHYKAVFDDNKSTTQKGKSLENLVQQLFGLCKHFEVTSDLRLHPNQIDCYVRNKLCTPGVPGLNGINNFCIECKNEEKTPGSGYINKLHSILTLSNISFGIIVSKAEAPRTFNNLANQIYLKENIVVISVSGLELKEIIMDKRNLLDYIEMKITAVKLNATKDLREIGLYK